MRSDIIVFNLPNRIISHLDSSTNIRNFIPSTMSFHILTKIISIILVTNLANGQSRFPPLCVYSGGRIPPPPGMAFCSLSPDDLASGRQLVGTRLVGNALPSWINVPLAQQGQKYLSSHRISYDLGAMYGLIAVLTIPDIRDVLVFTSNSDTPHKVLMRYIATVAQANLWLDDLVWPNSQESSSAFLMSIARVRQLHINAAEKAAKHGQPLVAPYYSTVPVNDAWWGAMRRDLLASNIPSAYRDFPNNYFKFGTNPIPINQFTQATTLFGFIGYFIINPANLWTHDATEADLRAVLHLWAVIGHALGIDDAYNICLQPDVASAKIYFQQVQNLYYTPSLFNLDHSSKLLIDALLNGMNKYFSGRSLVLLMLRDILNVPVPNLNSQLNLVERAGMLAYPAFLVGTHIPGFQATTALTFNAGLQGAIALFYGPYYSSMDWASYVYYNGTLGSN